MTLARVKWVRPGAGGPDSATEPTLEIHQKNVKGFLRGKRKCEWIAKDSQNEEL
jgi:hypothetical protein